MLRPTNECHSCWIAATGACYRHSARKVGVNLSGRVRNIEELNLRAVLVARGNLFQTISDTDGTRKSSDVSWNHCSTKNSQQ